MLLTLNQNEDGSGTLDAKDEGILDLMIAKSWAIKLATEAARTVLSVDQIIVARQAGGPKPPGPNPVSHNPRPFHRVLANTRRTGMKIRRIKSKTVIYVQYNVLTRLCLNNVFLCDRRKFSKLVITDVLGLYIVRDVLCHAAHDHSIRYQASTFRYQIEI